jgi:hypothetical protein
MKKRQHLRAVFSFGSLMHTYCACTGICAQKMPIFVHYLNENSERGFSIEAGKLIGIK